MVDKLHFLFADIKNKFVRSMNIQLNRDFWFQIINNMNLITNLCKYLIFIIFAHNVNV